MLLIDAAAASRRSLAAEAGSGLANARLMRPAERFALARAIDGAAKQLAQPECQGLLDEFSDVDGRPLRAALEAHGVAAADYPARVFFYDASPAACGGSNLAVTQPRSRAILVCGRRFARQVAGNSRHAEATIIHELLHSLGLGENPPSSDHITARVLARCR
jgi:hypothetical protein